MCLAMQLQLLALQAQVFTAQNIPDSIWTRMQGRSYPQECGIARSELCYLELSHYDFNGEEHIGQMVCNRQIAEDLLYIFSELYKVRYPIARMRLIDDYEARTCAPWRITTHRASATGILPEARTCPGTAVAWQ